MDTTAHDVQLVAGNQRQLLRRATPQRPGRDPRNGNPLLALVPDERITHFITRRWPAEAIQLAYLQRIAHSSTDGMWDMSLLFYHLPTRALLNARERRRARLSDLDAPVPVKWIRYGLTPAMRAAFDYPCGETSFIDPHDQGDGPGGRPTRGLQLGGTRQCRLLQTELINTQPSTGILADNICAQGPATTSGGWATMNVLIKPDTGQVAYNSKGQVQQVPVWSGQTSQFAEQAIKPVVTNAKNDTRWGRTSRTSTRRACRRTSPMSRPTASSGRCTTACLRSISPIPPRRSRTAFSQPVQRPEPRIRLLGWGLRGGSDRNVTFEAKNWYVRYLSLYIRYLDPTISRSR